MRLNGVQRLLEAGLIVTTTMAIFMLCALATFNPADPSWSQTGEFIKVQNITGTAGAWLADILFFTFGWFAYCVPVALALTGYLVFKRPHKLLELDYMTLGLRLIGLVLFVTSSTSIASINFDDIFYFTSGGVVGDVIASAMMPAFNFTGTSILLLCFFFAGLTLLTGVSWVDFVEQLGAFVVRTVKALKGRVKMALAERHAQQEARLAQSTDAEQIQADEPLAISHTDASTDEPLLVHSQKAPHSGDVKDVEANLTPQSPTNEHDSEKEPVVAFEDIAFSAIEEEPFDTEQALNALDEAKATGVDDEPQPAATKPPAYTKKVSAKEEFEALLAKEPPAEPLPSLALLDRPDKAKNPISQEELEAVSRLVEAKLLDFGVQAAVVGVYPGPVVTRFELDLAPGVKVAKISGLSKDLARSLSAVSVRVVEVIPGKTYVGIELPNKHREVVRLSEVISAPKFEQNASALTMVLGKDIAGSPVVVDLAKMPHLLVAGTTGSGKSVGVNVMILSLLYKSTPEDVRLIMIDPKMLELSVYEGIPHLLCEVVTDMKEAANGLRWCVGEMERRYKLMSALGVRNLKGYNAKILAAKEAGEPIRDPLWKDTDSMDEQAPYLEKLPSIVVVIDEFADMMMIVGKKVEELIARIAQKARAAGIHLVLATQRPSVDVITGLIKANIPTRMAFQVSSKIDSRTILDQQGAEHLLGMGDMLYLPPGTSVPMRVHGAFVDDHEVHAVVNDWKARGKPNYIDDILNGDAGEDALLPGEAAESEDGEADPLYDEAVAFVIDGGRVSVSSVQRKLRVGYNRAARLVEQMEMSGVVSAPGHNGAREVLVGQQAN